MPRPNDTIGNFELMILLAIMQVGDNAYGVPIAQEIEKHRGKPVSIGAIYAALERLESKDFVTSEMGEALPERGGRAKRYFRITKKGISEVQDTRRALIGLWSRLPQLLEKRS